MNASKCASRKRVRNDRHGHAGKGAEQRGVARPEQVRLGGDQRREVHSIVRVHRGRKRDEFVVRCLQQGGKGDEPNAADFQIAATLRVMLSFHDLRPSLEGRPAAGLARRLVPHWPDEVPPFLPREWLPHDLG